MNFVQTGRLSVAQPLHAFVEREALPGTGISAVAFWSVWYTISESAIGSCSTFVMVYRRASTLITPAVSASR